ncbi:hypothetical protein [Nonlabens antarcticus]|uniref:hypothetical protein n=1 Tax=Nonlabens antarcticus TaxID=392714 RepID=UPI001891C743|nr:hypothetical protein [Nonlabens antarcticus]
MRIEALLLLNIKLLLLEMETVLTNFLEIQASLFYYNDKSDTSSYQLSNESRNLKKVLKQYENSDTTAISATTAIKLTDIYFATNPDVTDIALGQFFKQQITNSLRSVGGSINKNRPPFPIRNPAPYITRIIGLSDPYNRN